MPLNRVLGNLASSMQGSRKLSIAPVAYPYRTGALGSPISITRKINVFTAWSSLVNGVFLPVAMAQTNSLQQLRQALEALHIALETLESALVEFEEGLDGGGAQRPESGTRFDLLSIEEVCQELGMGKSWVYEATQNPVAREMIGYLIVRGGVHQEAYTKALSDLSGVDVTKLLPMPEIDTNNYPDARKYMDKGFHRILYRFSPDDYKEISQIWNGLSAIDGSEREVQDGPPEGGEVSDLNPAPPLFAPGVDAEDIAEIAKRLG